MVNARFVAVLATVGAVLAVCAALAGAAPSASGSLAIGLPHSTVAAGQTIEVTLTDRGRVTLVFGQARPLQRRDGSRWVAVTRTHGVAIPEFGLNMSVGAVTAGASRTLAVVLYDDLKPGTYRVQVPYQPAATSGPPLPLAADAPVATLDLKVTAFNPGPEPKLSRSRLLKLALAAGRVDSDAHPTSVQWVENTEFNDALVASGQLTFTWKWAYLISIRGHFTGNNVPILPGTKPATGTVFTFIVDARTGRTDSFWLSNSSPDLARLGPVTTAVPG